MAFWNGWLRKKDDIKETRTIAYASQSDREIIKNWVQNINDSIVGLKADLEKVPMLTVSKFNEKFEDRSEEVIEKLEDLPKSIIEPLKETIVVSKQDILAKLMRISSHYSAHDSNDSVNDSLLLTLYNQVG